MDLNDKKPVLAPSRAKRMYLILAAVVVVILIAWGAFALVTSGKESTDDAHGAAELGPVAARGAAASGRGGEGERDPPRPAAGGGGGETPRGGGKETPARAEGELETAK